VERDGVTKSFGFEKGDDQCLFVVKGPSFNGVLPEKGKNREKGEHLSNRKKRGTLYRNSGEGVWEQKGVENLCQRQGYSWERTLNEGVGGSEPFRKKRRP